MEPDAMKKERGSMARRTDRRFPRGGRLALILPAAFLAAAFLGLCAWQILETIRADGLDVFYDGVTIDGVAVGGKTWDQARMLVESDQRLRGKTLLFVLENEDAEWFVDGGEVGGFNTGEILERAWAVGRGDPAWLRWMERTSARLFGWRLYARYSLDMELLEARLKEISRELYTAPVNARVTGFDPAAEEGSRLLIRDDAPGYGLDIESMLMACAQAVERNGWGTIVPIALGAVRADVTAADLSAMEPPIVSYGFRPGDYAALREGLRAECEAVGAVVLDPGETFSLRQALASAGAASLERRTILPTVIYGAALHAGLTVLERHRENGMGLPVAPGLEAVTGDRRDLALRNDTGQTMVLWVRAEGSGLTARVYRMPYENCAYVRVIGLSRGEEEPAVYRIFCDENGRELGREQVLS